MQKYWAENQQVQKWGLLVIKIWVLGSFGIVICEIARESISDFIPILRNPSLWLPYCTPDCNFSWIIGLFGLLCVYEISLLIGLLKAPKGFWLNFLLVFWGILGLVCLSEAWQYSWRPKIYSWSFETMSYMQYIIYNSFLGIWAAIGILQVYLRPGVRKYAIGLHTGISVCGFLIGGIMKLFFGEL